MKLGRRSERLISQYLKKRTGYDYHALLINVGAEVRFLIHSEDKYAEKYKKENVWGFNTILYVMTGLNWVRREGEENWVVINKKSFV